MLAHHELVSHLEDLLKIGCDGLSLYAEPAVGADAYTVLARHCEHRHTIVVEDRLFARD